MANMIQLNPGTDSLSQSMPEFFSPTFLDRTFNPGNWLDKRQVSTPSCIGINGSYERNTAVSGGFYTEEVHFFDLTLAGRPTDSRGQLIDYFDRSHPLGEVLFVPAGYRYFGSGGQGQQRTLFLFLNAKSVQAEDAELASALAAPKLLEFMNLRSDRIKSLLTQIAKETYTPGLASELMIESLSTTLLVESVRFLHQARGETSTKGGLAPYVLRRVRERVMDENKPPSLTELAELCNLSRRHLMRAFRESMGQTVGQYIQSVVAEKAKHLLSKTDKSVGEIALILGFVNTPTFSTAFRRETGQSPSVFRRRLLAYDLVIEERQ